MKRIALYPGTFDPVTNGHLDIIYRASSLCDELIIGVAENIGKNPFFEISKRKCKKHSFATILQSAKSRANTS